MARAILDHFQPRRAARYDRHAQRDETIDSDYFGDPVFEYSSPRHRGRLFLPPLRCHRVTDAHGFAPNQSARPVRREIPQGFNHWILKGLPFAIEAAAYTILLKYLHRTDRWAKTIVLRRPGARRPC